MVVILQWEGDRWMLFTRWAYMIDTLTIGITLVLSLVCHSFGMVLPVVYLPQYAILTGICNRLPPTILIDHWGTVVK
jgi:hypothetical protein